MPKHYFTFGQNHSHVYCGITLDKDIVVEIDADNPREKMVEIFGQAWSMEYTQKPDMAFFPRGIKKI